MVWKANGCEMTNDSTHWAESRDAVVDGIGMRWLEVGRGRPVVFVHGIPTSPALWRYVAPNVSEARCLCWEMVGYGSSMGDAQQRDISVENQASCLLAWMQQLNIDRAILVGHDLGGGVVQIAADRNPERCCGIVLVNSICYNSWPILSVRLLRQLAPIVGRLPNSLFRHLFATFLKRGHDDSERCAESIDEHWRHYASCDAAAAFLHQINCLDARDTKGVAERIGSSEIPARVIWGVADPYQKLHYGERLAMDLGTQLMRIENGRHFVPEDEPGPVIYAISELIKHVKWSTARQAMSIDNGATIQHATDGT